MGARIRDPEIRDVKEVLMTSIDVIDCEVLTEYEETFVGDNLDLIEEQGDAWVLTGPRLQIIEGIRLKLEREGLITPREK